jgi:hypothetical protein
VTDDQGIRKGAELSPGRYYGRWLEHDDPDFARVACNCGFRSPWDSERIARLFADEIHGAH